MGNDRLRALTLLRMRQFRQEDPMDPSRFDTLTRTFASGYSRRGLLVVAAGSAVGMAELAEIPDAAAKSCPPCRKKKNGRCKKKRRDGAPCGNNNRCRNGHCDPNACTADCSGTPGPRPCGPHGSSCQCVNVVEGTSACVKNLPGEACGTETVCNPGLICGIPCTTYLSSCWEPCV
jgi:hypothetical protein